jgi:predicted rRNA methylase
MDCIVKPHNENVRLTYQKFAKRLELDQLEPVLRKAAGGLKFYNISSFTLSSLLDDARNIELNFRNYLNGFNAEVQDILDAAKAKDEAPFIFVLDGIEDPHNLGAIIRTANLCGAHGVIIPKRRAVGLTATVAKTSAGALNYTPVAKVTNLSTTIEELKKEGLWFVCADMGGDTMYKVNLKGPIGLVIGNEGEGVSRLVKEKCDFTASIPMHGNIDSLNASVAAGVLAYEIVRQRME